MGKHYLFAIIVYFVSIGLRLSCEGMEVGFYSPTCPDAESVVRATVQKSFQSDKTIAAALLRLHYHDCFVQGCDGSVLIAGPKAENTASGHSGLRGFDVIENAKKQLEGICPGVVSCADIVALAARDAVALSNGPDYDVPTGRRDGVVSSAKDASDMPDPTDSIQLLQQKFAAKGLSTSDLVVLNGAHTIGTTACFFIKDRLYNFPPAGDADPTINPSYLGDLRAVCPWDGDDNVRLPLDRGSEFNFDKQFFDNVMQGNGVLESDANMYEDASTRPYIDSYFGLLGGLLGPSFESDFAEAMIRMGQLKYPPVPINDKVTHVYTAVIYPNSTMKVLVDGEEKKTANLLSDDFDPPVLPPKTIPDPDDKKPEDWDERAKIPDPEAKKPDDWDEDAPMEIEDLEAEKPEGWLDDEPEEIDDPESTKPDDWDDDEDGDWEAPKIPNPKCEEAPGCGEWKRPVKRNPNYKGKWYPPMIDNPNYKGIWKPRQIQNPDYFELERPNLESIAAIGIEIWTMQDRILFDNVLISEDVSEAQEYRDKYWKPKFEIEKEKHKVEEEVEAGIPGSLSGIKGKVFDSLYKVVDLPFLSSYKEKLTDVIQKGEKSPNLTIGILISIFVVFLTFIYKIIFGGKRAPPAPVENTVAGTSPANAASDNSKEELSEDTGEKEEEPSGEIEKEGEETSGTRHRRSRRET